MKFCLAPVSSRLQLSWHSDWPAAPPVHQGSDCNQGSDRNQEAPAGSGLTRRPSGWQHAVPRGQIPIDPKTTSWTPAPIEDQTN